MDMPEKLELIAKCIREGTTIQTSIDQEISWNDAYTNTSNTSGYFVVNDAEYRAKPEKPRKSRFGRPEIEQTWLAVELTPEVSKVLEDAGIEI